jgi:hypothetical protein
MPPACTTSRSTRHRGRPSTLWPSGCARRKPRSKAPPGERDYSAGYYAVFFFDPDGLKLEVVHAPD